MGIGGAWVDTGAVLVAHGARVPHQAGSVYPCGDASAVAHWAARDADHGIREETAVAESGVGVARGRDSLPGEKMAQRKVTMTLEGVDALKAAVTRAPAVLKAHVGSANHTTAFAISQRMRATAPDRTGTLKRSISVA